MFFKSPAHVISVEVTILTELSDRIVEDVE